MTQNWTNQQLKFQAIPLREQTYKNALGSSVNKRHILMMMMFLIINNFPKRK